MQSSMHRADQLLRWWDLDSDPGFVEKREQLATTIDVAVEQELRAAAQQSVSETYEYPTYVLMVPRGLVNDFMTHIKHAQSKHGLFSDDLAELFDRMVECTAEDGLYP